MKQADITGLFQAHRAGDGTAMPRAFGLLYSDLKKIAGHHVNKGLTPTLNPTSLVNELYLKLIDRSVITPNDRQHFYALAAQAMRQIVIDYVRERKAQKRGGDQEFVTVGSTQVPVESSLDNILEIERALGHLAKYDRRLVSVVECRYFAGLSEEETAQALDSSVSTVQRDWQKVKGWLREFIDSNS